MAKSKGDAAGEGRELSQRAMVRAALEERGGDAKPHELQQHIKERFNKELPANIISNYKSQLKREGVIAGGRRTRLANGLLRVEHFEQVQALIKEIGVDNLKRLVDVIG